MLGSLEVQSKFIMVSKESNVLKIAGKEYVSHLSIRISIWQLAMSVNIRKLCASG